MEIGQKEWQMKIKYHNRGDLTLRVFLGMYFFSLSFIISAVAGACLA